MTRPKQKKSERRAVDIFRRLCDDPPDGKLFVPSDGAGDPDFVFESPSGTRIGLEVRRLLRGGETKNGALFLRRDGRRRSILQRAFHNFRQSSDDSIDLSVTWAERSIEDYKTVEKSEERDMFPPEEPTAEQLADLVRSKVPPKGKHVRATVEELLSAGLAPYINGLRIWHLPDELDQIPWHEGSHLRTEGFWPGVTPQTVQDAIDDKKAKLEKHYSKACDQTWLLLYVPFKLSEAYAVGNITDSVGDKAFDSGGFERVFILAEDGPQLVQLALRD